MEGLRDKMYMHALDLVSMIEQQGGRAISFYSNIFSTDSQLSSNIEVNLPPIQTALSVKQIPVLIPLATNPESQLVPVCARSALSILTEAVYKSEKLNNPVKVILINERGGVVATGSENDTVVKPLKFINLKDEFKGLCKDLQDVTAADFSHPVTTSEVVSPIPYENFEILPPANNTFKLQPLSKCTSKPKPTPPIVLSGSKYHNSIPSIQNANKLKEYKQNTLADIKLIQKILSFLPPTSSAIMASPESSPGLIMNLITDKPLPAKPSMLPGTSKEDRVKKKSKPVTLGILGDGPVIPLTLDSVLPPTTLRKGLKVHCHTSLDDSLDIPLLNSLLESSFGRKVMYDSYWKRINETVDGVILSTEGILNFIIFY